MSKDDEGGSGKKPFSNIPRNYDTGYGKPPVEHQFKPGESGNAAGRPMGTKNKRIGQWTLLGVAYSAVQTPTGRLLRRSAQSQHRPAIFAAQFALSHACWLVTYPLAGWFGSVAGMPTTLMVLGIVSAFGTHRHGFLCHWVCPWLFACLMRRAKRFTAFL